MNTNNPPREATPSTPIDDKKGIDIKELILIDTLQFCSIAKISVRTAFEWRRDGIIPCVRIKGRIFYRFSDVCALIEKSALKKLIKE